MVQQQQQRFECGEGWAGMGLKAAAEPDSGQHDMTYSPFLRLEDALISSALMLRGFSLSFLLQTSISRS
jgi:hypothetical protein